MKCPQKFASVHASPHNHFDQACPSPTVRLTKNAARQHLPSGGRSWLGLSGIPQKLGRLETSCGWTDRSLYRTQEPISLRKANNRQPLSYFAIKCRERLFSSLIIALTSVKEERLMTARPLIANAMARSGKAPVNPPQMPHASEPTEAIANMPAVSGPGSPKKQHGTFLTPSIHQPLEKIHAGQFDRRSKKHYSLNGLPWKCELEGSLYL